jgi:hypothetical protein
MLARLRREITTRLDAREQDRQVVNQQFQSVADGRDAVSERTARADQHLQPAQMPEPMATNAGKRSRTRLRVPQCPLRRQMACGSSESTQAGQFPEWLDLNAAQAYICVSERTLREWIHRDSDPLPAVQLNGMKIFIRRSQLDRWMESHAIRPGSGVDVDQMVNEVLGELLGAS